jgi:hypothetical protein
VFSKIKAMSDKVGDSSKLTDCGMLLAEAKFFRRQNVILMNKIIQSVACSSL